MAYKAHKHAPLRVFRLKGSLYGQRDAPVRWWETLKEWLINDQGFHQSKNDVCLFRHPVTKLKVGTHVDDIKVKGKRHHTKDFWAALDAEFGLKSWAFVGPEGCRFLGVNLAQRHLTHDGNKQGGMYYTIDQNADMLTFLEEHCEAGWTPVKSPMPKTHELHSDRTPVPEKEARRYRSLTMSLAYFATMTRLDLCMPVSRLAGDLKAPTVGSVRALNRVLRYLLGRPSFTLSTRRRVPGRNQWEFYVDSDLAGDTQCDSRSRTGIVLLLNGMPVLWRSKKMPHTAYSSAASEVFAFSEAVRECRLLLWRAEDLGAKVQYPFVLHEDNAATVSFQKSTTPYSKLRGIYNLRDQWVKELKNTKIVEARKVATENNIADLLTKCHEHSSMKRLLQLMHLHEG